MVVKRINSLDELVVEVISWVDTPFVPQASTKGMGTDCLGIIKKISECNNCPSKLGGLLIDHLRHVVYCPFNDHEWLQSKLPQHLDILSEVIPGSICLFKVAKRQFHLGIIVEKRSKKNGERVDNVLTVVHACSLSGKVIKAEVPYYWQLIEKYAFHGLAPRALLVP